MTGSGEERQLLRLGGWSAIVGSLLGMVGNLVHPVTPMDDPEGVAEVIADTRHVGADPPRDRPPYRADAGWTCREPPDHSKQYQSCSSRPALKRSNMTGPSKRRSARIDRALWSLSASETSTNGAEARTRLRCRRQSSLGPQRVVAEDGRGCTTPRERDQDHDPRRARAPKLGIRDRTQGPWCSPMNPA
jgi:hypothetical protein